MENKNSNKVSAENYFTTSEDLLATETLIDKKTVIELQKKYQSNYEQLKKQEEIISITSHELKTPITTIKLFLNLLEELTQNEENHCVYELVQKAETQVERLVKLVNNLQEMSELHDGKMDLQKEIFDFSVLLNNCADTFRLQNPAHSLSVNCGETIDVYADISRIEQVLINFISNAIKYSPDAGQIEITVELFDQSLKLSVTDSGIGITEPDLPKVFDCYFRAHQTDKRFKGSGLGLYICKEIITQHGGEIGAISKENKGSTFWFTLPLAK